MQRGPETMQDVQARSHYRDRAAGRRMPPHLLVAGPVIMAELGPALALRAARSTSLSGTPLASGHDRLA